MSPMKTSVALLGAATLTLLASGCTKKTDHAAADPAAVEKAVQADEKKWNEDFKAKSLEGLLSHYSDDAYSAVGGPPASGSTEIRKAYSNALADHYFSVDFASDKFDASGDLAYSRGHFTESHQDPKSHQIVTQKGSYLTVYKKQPDGSWKAVEDFATPDPTTRTEKSPVVKPAKMISF